MMLFTLIFYSLSNFAFSEVTFREEEEESGFFHRRTGGQNVLG